MRLSPLLPAALMLLVATAPIAVGAQAGRAAYDEGRRLMSANEPAKAEKQFERAISAEPNVSLYHLWLGNAVGEQAQNASVLRQPFMARRIKAEFEKAVELDPTSIDAREGLLGFFLQAPAVMGGGLDKAQEQAREIGRLHVIRGHMATARIAWHQKDTVATERAHRAAISAWPDSAGPTIQFAQRLQGWNRNADAFATYDAFLARQPRHTAVRYQVARLVAITGDHLPRGERILRELIADSTWEAGGFMPPRAAVHARLGDVLRKQGKRDEARTSYNTAVSLDANSQIAKHGLAALRGS
jgi:tetratricopeptide (TPR) repeat protein